MFTNRLNIRAVSLMMCMASVAVVLALTARGVGQQTQPAVPTAEQVLEELRKRPTAQPLVPVEPGKRWEGQVRGSSGQVGVGKAKQPLLPDGYVLVDRSGRLVKEGQWSTLVLEGTGQSGQKQRRIRLLPNHLLEMMERISAGGTRSVLFEVTGEVTVYRGMNYLLVRHVMMKQSMGNLQK